MKIRLRGDPKDSLPIMQSLLKSAAGVVYTATNLNPPVRGLARAVGDERTIIEEPSGPPRYRVDTVGLFMQGGYELVVERVGIPEEAFLEMVPDASLVSAVE